MIRFTKTENNNRAVVIYTKYLLGKHLGRTLGLVVLLHPKEKKKGLTSTMLAHELTHVDQFYTRKFNMLYYLVDADFQMSIEAEAYVRQIQAGLDLGQVSSVEHETLKHSKYMARMYKVAFPGIARLLSFRSKPYTEEEAMYAIHLQILKRTTSIRTIK